MNLNMIDARRGKKTMLQLLIQIIKWVWYSCTMFLFIAGCINKLNKLRQFVFLGIYVECSYLC